MATDIIEVTSTLPGEGWWTGRGSDGEVISLPGLATLLPAGVTFWGAFTSFILTTTTCVCVQEGIFPSNYVAEETHVPYPELDNGDIAI